MNYKQRKSVLIRVFFIMLDALLPQQLPQGNKIPDMATFCFCLLDFGGRMVKQEKEELWQDENKMVSPDLGPEE